MTRLQTFAAKPRETSPVGPLVFVMPMPPNKPNGRGNRFKWQRLKLEFMAACDERQSAGLIPPPPAVPIAKATLSSVMHLGSDMDEDNSVSRHKPALDWLKTRGYIADDRRKNLRWLAFPEQVIKRKGATYRLELTLTPVVQ